MDSRKYSFFDSQYRLIGLLHLFEPLCQRFGDIQSALGYTSLFYFLENDKIKILKVARAIHPMLAKVYNFAKACLYSTIKQMSWQIANRIMLCDQSCGWKSLLEMLMVQQNGTDQIEMWIVQRASWNYGLYATCRGYRMQIKLKYKYKEQTRIIDYRVVFTVYYITLIYVSNCVCA